MASLPSSDHWQRLEELFHTALELEPAQRAEFLDRSCDGDAALRREVEALLNSSEKSWGFFQKPLQATAEQVSATAETSQQLGPYRIVRLIGEGGMGKVYLATRADKLYEQQVAIKLVQTHVGRMGDLLMRFSSERQILANLAHPNIARLLDAGISPDGAPYLVMEYIEGVPIDKYVAANALSVRARLELFQTVCSAVEYAHRNLVVHRDIKPGNILVTTEGSAKLLDFGIAKLQQPTGAGDQVLTRATERLMTPEYASPEQARGRAITTATDVYALGALLYALLTGRPPFSIVSRDPLEVAQIICERPPTRPSASVKREAGLPKHEKGKLKGDLDNIVLKALRKEPEKRYATVGELAEDVRRYQEGYPLQAGSGAWSYRAAKFIRRHKIAVSAAVLMTLAVLGFSAGMGILARHARREQSTAAQEAQFLSSLFAAATPDVQRGKTITARDVLDLGAKRIDAELGGQPEVRAAMLDNIGWSYFALGDYDQAKELLEKSYTLRRQTLGDNALPTAESAEHYAEALRIQGNYAAAEPLLRQALSIRQKQAGPRSQQTGESLTDLGECLFLLGRLTEAEPILRQAINVVSPEWPQAAGARNYLGQVLMAEGRYGEAAQSLHEAVDIDTHVLGADAPDTMISMHNWAGSLMDLGNLTEGEKVERQVLAARQRVSGPDHPDTAYSLNNLGWVLLERGDWAGAEPFLAQNLEYIRKRLGDQHPRLASALNNWARLEQGKGNYDEAEKYYRQALTVLQEDKAGEGFSAAKIEANLGLLELDRGRYSAAEQWSRHALELRKKRGGDQHPDVASSLLDVGIERSFQGDLAGAEPMLRQALEIRSTRLGTAHMLVIAAKVRLGEVLTAEAKLPEAESVLREAVNSAHNSPFALVPWQVADAESALGVCLARRGQNGEARSLIEKSMAALKTHPEAALRKRALAKAASVLAQAGQ